MGSDATRYRLTSVATMGTAMRSGLSPIVRSRHCETRPRNISSPVLTRVDIVQFETYRWLVRMVLLLRLGRNLRLSVQALPSLAGVGLIWTAHTAVVVDRMETAGGCGSRALLIPHTACRTPRARSLRSISARESPVLMFLRLEKECHSGSVGRLAQLQRRGKVYRHSLLAMSV